MKCPYCGQKLERNADFCDCCNNRLTEGPTSAGQVQKDKTPLIIGLGVIAIVLIIAVACILLLNPFGSRSKTVYQPEAFGPEVSVQPDAPSDTPTRYEMPGLPENARPVSISAGDTVGLPVPDAQPEALQTAADAYRALIEKTETAEKYGLIDFFGDDIPELILQEGQEDGSSCFRIYYLEGESVFRLTTDAISATEDTRLVGKKGTLMVCYGQEFINCVTVDSNRNAKVNLIKAESVPAYTESTVLAAASDRYLLDLVLLGDCEAFTGTGWFRKDGVEYYYQYGKPVTRQWVEEDGIHYYLGDSGCITEAATQDIIADVLSAYFAEYQTAFSEKDASMLILATENNRTEEAARFRTEENRHLLISDLTCTATLRKGNNWDGSITADVQLEYIQCGDWENAEKIPAEKAWSVTLFCVDGQWHVNQIANP